MKEPLPLIDYVTQSAFVPKGLPFASGDRLSQRAFHDLFLKTPDGVRAELIEGTVFVASPVSSLHAKYHRRLVGWIDRYVEATPGVEGYDNATQILGPDTEVMPDVSLLVEPECGGQVRYDGKYLSGSPELVIEVALSSVAIDLRMKKSDYERAGVKEYLVVILSSKAIQWFIRKGKRFVESQPVGGVIRSREFPGLWLDLAGLFSNSTKAMSTTLGRGLASPEHAAFAASLHARRNSKNSVTPKRFGKSK